MKNEKGVTVLGVLLLLAVVLSGWFLNLYKLYALDFEQPYRAEAIRLAGVFPPVGIVVGWMTIGEENKEEVK